MNFHGKAVMVYLEEDNIARAYFRVQPLLTQEGIVGADALKEFPDDGYLRIVPDKNEQHTFKERMRSLCGVCMMDLRFLPSEANKIRTNKNYSPSRGETNQYIVYSDAVRPMADDLMYQVVAENDRESAVTPCVYIRNGANIQGPFRKDNGQIVGEIVQLPPDSPEIHAVTWKNGPEILIYWPRAAAAAPAAEPISEQAAAPAPAVSSAEPAPVIQAEPEKKAVPEKEEKDAYAQIQEMNQQLSESANLLDAKPTIPADLMPDQPQKPLAGTRLYQSPLRAVSPKRAYNPLMEVVEQQRYAAKYEAPGAVLAQNAELKDVANPVAALKRTLQGIWNSTEAQQQAVDVLLSQPSMRVLLSKAMAADGRDATLTAMKSQLQELEAERLMTLMQLDDAKKNLSAFRDEALAEITREQQKKLDELNIAEQKAKNALAAANKALEPLNQKCQEAAKKLDDMQALNDPRILCPAAGQDVKKAELIARLEKSMAAAGFSLQPGDALALLTAYALAENDLVLRAESESDALLAWQALANALGCKIIQAYWGWTLQVLNCGDAPLFVRSSDEVHPLITHVLTAAAEEEAEECDCHEEEPAYPCACLTLETSLTAIPGALPAYPAVSKKAVLREMLQETALNQDTLALIQALRTALKAAGAALPLIQVKALSRFIAATQNAFSGGVAEAIDRAVCAYAVPHILLHKLPVDELKPLLAAMPRTLKALNA